MKLLNVPFVQNLNDRCVSATIGMVLAYFCPDKHYTMDELDKLTGYIPEQGTWQTKSMISLSNLGFQTKWIEDFDHIQFSRNPELYLASILDEESLKWQIKHSDLAVEAKRMTDYIASGHTIEQRKGTKEDIIQLIDDGWLVRLEVNANTLAGRPGYDGHSILVIGYDDKDVAIHNPDGVNGNRPSQITSWELLEKAWREFGGSFSIYAFKK